jgi:hypothetical protein
MDLQQLLELIHDVGWGTFLFTSAHTGRRLHDIAKFVSQIVFASHSTSVDSYTGTNRGRWHRQDSEDHPFRPRIYRRQSKQMKIKVGDFLEEDVYLLWGEQSLVGLHRLHFLCMPSI